MLNTLLSKSGLNSFVRRALVALLITCFPAIANADTESDVKPAPQKLRIAYSGISGSQVPAWVAYEHGFFRKYGLDVELVFAEGGSRAVKTLLSGDVAAAQVGGSAVLRSRLEGSGLILIAGFLNTMDYKLVVAKDITRPDQLKGKAVAVSRIGSSSDFATRYALEKYGLKPDKDVTFLQIGGQPARFAALEAGKIQGVMIAVPLTMKAKKLGFNTLADLQMLGLEYQHTGLAVNQALIKSQPDLVARILKAFVEAIHFYKTNREESLQILAKYLKTDNREELEETYEAIGLTLIPEKPYPTLKGIDVMLQELATKEPKARGAKPEQFVDLRFIRELDRSGFIDKLYNQPVTKTAKVETPAGSVATEESGKSKEVATRPKANEQKEKKVAKSEPMAPSMPGRVDAPEMVSESAPPSTSPSNDTQATAKVNVSSPSSTGPARGQEYVIQPGDTLSKLSLVFYRTSFKWPKIYEANRDTVKNPDYIYIGQKLIIPPAEEPPGV